MQVFECEQRNKSLWAVLFNSTVYYDVQDGVSNWRVFEGTILKSDHSDGTSAFECLKESSIRTKIIKLTRIFVVLCKVEPLLAADTSSKLTPLTS